MSTFKAIGANPLTKQCRPRIKRAVPQELRGWEGMEEGWCRKHSDNWSSDPNENLNEVTRRRTFILQSQPPGGDSHPCSTDHTKQKGGGRERERERENLSFTMVAEKTQPMTFSHPIFVHEGLSRGLFMGDYFSLPSYYLLKSGLFRQ